MTSGTLAYSFGLGKAVVSTPYWHARELLADGRGILVPFGDAAAIGSEIAGLLTDDARRQAMRKRAYASSRSMTWERTAERYLAAFESARRGHRLSVIARLDRTRGLARQPGAARDADRSSSVHVRRHRAFPACGPFGARPFPRLLRRRQCPRAAAGVRAQRRRASSACPKPLTSRLAAFVQHAWNPDVQAVSQLHELRSHAGSKTAARRIAMGGRSGPWASVRAATLSPSRRRWAASLFAEALPAAESFRSPRAWAFTLLGLDAYCAVVADDVRAKRIRRLLADRLMAILSAVRDEGLGVVRGGACLRQCAPAPGVDRDRHRRRMRPPMSRPA